MAHHLLCQIRNHGPLQLEVGTRIALAIWVKNCAVMGSCVESNSFKEENGSSHPLSEPGSMLGLWRFTRSFSRLQCLVPAVPRPPLVQHSSRSKELGSTTLQPKFELVLCWFVGPPSGWLPCSFLNHWGWLSKVGTTMRRAQGLLCSAVNFQDVQEAAY